MPDVWIPSREDYAALVDRVGGLGADVEDSIARLESRSHATNQRLDALEEQAHEPPLPTPPEPEPAPEPVYEVRRPIILEGVTDQVIERFEITVPDGPDPAILLTNCRNLTIRDYRVHGGQIAVEGCKDITLGLGLVEHVQVGRSSWSDREAGIRILGSERITVADSVAAYWDSNIRVEASHDVTLDGNFTYNPRGPMPRGQHIQTWRYGGIRSERLLIKNHYALTDWTRSPAVLRTAETPYGTWQEDAISIGGAIDVRLFHVLTEMVGLADVTPGDVSRTGSGLMFEGAEAVVDGFISIGQANVGFGVTELSDVSFEDVLSIIPVQHTANQAGYAWHGGSVAFGDDVRLYGTKPDGGPYGTWWDDGTVDITGKDGVRLRHTNNSLAAVELAAVVRPTIPDVGFVLP